MTSATLPPVVTTSSTTRTRAPGHLERPAEHHRALLALAEDELDPKRLRHGEADDEAADRRSGDEVDV